MSKELRSYRWGKTILLAILLLSSWGYWAFAQDMDCKYCGMKKSQFGHSWVIITHSNEDVEEVCSIHCAVIDIALHTDKPVGTITVGDYGSHKQIDAEAAFWVIGGEKPGVMTARAKWAFETRSDAQRFIEAYGGKHADFNEAIKTAFEDMYHDTLVIQKKRRMTKLREDAANK